jgi:hypothetical protein
MEWLTDRERQGLFGSFERDAFHLEMRDEYHIEDEAEPLRMWRRVSGLTRWPANGGRRGL